MTLRDHLRLLRQHWRLIVGCLILGLCGAAVVTYYQPRSYSADVRMYVAWQVTPDSPSSARELALLSEQRVRSYEQLVRGDRVGQEVVARLGLPLTPGEVRQKLSANAALDTVVLTVTATDESPARAADIANASAAAVVGLVQALEQPPNLAQPPPVMLRIVEPATPPQAPVWPNPPLNLAAGAAFGLLVGVGLVGLRRVLDDSVRTSGQLRSLTRAPVLGTFSYSRRMAKRALSPDGLRQLPEAEAVRRARTSLQLLIKGGGKVVGITSSVAQEGQTAALRNIAMATADAGWKVVAVEGDLRRPTLAQYFGLEPEPGLRDVLIGQVSLDDAVRTADRNLDVLSSAPVSGDPSAQLSSKPMADLMATLRQRYDIVLVDVPPLLSDAGAALVASHTDGCVLVVRYGRTTGEEVGEAMSVLASASVPLLGTIMTMVTRGARIRDVGVPSGDVPAPAATVGLPYHSPAPAHGTQPAAPAPSPAPVQRNGSASGVTAEIPSQGALRRRPSPRPRNAGSG
jgi:polysaccharide biosynthesis transport protein